MLTQVEAGKGKDANKSHLSKLKPHQLLFLSTPTRKGRATTTTASKQNISAMH